MSRIGRVTGWGLRLINRLTGPLERLGLRPGAQRMLYRASRSGFRAAGAASRRFQGSRDREQAARPEAPPRPDLFDLTPTDEQQLLRDELRRFARERLRPAAAQADRDCAAPPELLAETARLGLAALGVPEALGGAAGTRGAVTAALAAEALAEGDMGLAVACLSPAAVSTALGLWGDEPQQSAYLPAFLADAPVPAALAILEARPLFDALALQARARNAGGGYVLDGAKSLVPIAHLAELFLVAAQRDDGTPALFLVESGSVGLSIEAEPAMGLRAASLGRLVLRDVKLPPGALLGTAADYRQCLALSRLAWCALACGTAQAVLGHVVPYVNERVAFGEPVSHRQGVAFPIANIAIELEGMRLATWRAAARAQGGEPFAREAALARALCARHGMAIGSDGVQMLGGHGFVKEHPVERWYRDLRAIGVMEGGVLL